MGDSNTNKRRIYYARLPEYALEPFEFRIEIKYLRHCNIYILYKIRALLQAINTFIDLANSFVLKNCSENGIRTFIYCY